MYLCPLSRDSRFCLNRLQLQRNCNATDCDAMTSEDVNSFPRSFIIDSQHTRIPMLSSTRATMTGANTSSRLGDSAPNYNKHVGFAAACNAAQGQRSRSKSSHQQPQLLQNLQQHQQQHQQDRRQEPQQRRRNSSVSQNGSGTNSALTRILDTNASGRISGAHLNQTRNTDRMAVELPFDRCHHSSMLVPLTGGQSNLNSIYAAQTLLNRSSHNAHPPDATKQEPPTQATTPASGANPPGGGDGGCNVVGRGGGKSGDLMPYNGVGFWNVFEFQDFRQLQHGQPHVFDPQIDPYLHRESILLDNYNRLSKSHPRFRHPNPLYHVR